MRVKITVAYDGMNFCGWQVQPNGVSVQSVLQDAIFNATGERVIVTGSGRTDAGVHANGQVAHFDLKNENLPPERISFMLNTFLPKEVRVIDSKRASDDFDARKSAKKKTYRYNFYLSDTENPLYERYCERMDNGVDVKKLNEACEIFVGEHNFKAFSASGGSAKTFERRIFEAKAVRRGKFVYLQFTGSGFLYNMVRLLSGAVVEYSKGKLKKEEIEEMLTSGERTHNIKTMPSKALVLYKVVYK